MRNLTRLLGASLVLAWALSFGPPLAEAGQVCETTCSSGTTLQCCTTGYCTADSSGIDCNGTLMSCSTVDSYNACLNDCETQKNACIVECNFLSDCYYEYCHDPYLACKSNCGPAPPTNIGC